MKTITSFILIAAVALGLIGCGAPANNAPANTNTNANTTKPVAAAPTVNDLQALDKAANEAYFKGDSAYFETFLSDKYGSTENGKHSGKADAVKYIAGVKCDMKSFEMSDPAMSKIDDDTYVFSYTGTVDGTCNDGPGGKVHKLDSPIRAATVFVRSGDKWQAALHNEQKMMEPKKDEKAADTTKKDEKAADPTKKLPAAQKEDAAKKEEPKKEETAKKEEPKKEEAGKPIGATKTAPANATAASTAPAAATADANTDALVKAELAGWTAWKDHDAKALDSYAAKTLAIVDPSGKWVGTRAEVLKGWETEDCKDVKNVNIKDGFAWALSPTVEILTFTGSADGTCGGMKNGTYWGSSVYVKEGNDWKLAFNFLQPAHKS